MLATQYWCATPKNRYGLALFRQHSPANPCKYLSNLKEVAPEVYPFEDLKLFLMKTFRGLPYPDVPSF